MDLQLPFILQVLRVLPLYALVTRYKQKLKEKADGFRKPFKATYDAVQGPNSYEYRLKTFASTNDAWSELLFLCPDLSSNYTF